MTNQRNALLAGIAALALVAGAGLATAQDKSPDNKTAPHQMNKAPGAGKLGQSTQDKDRNAGANMERSNPHAQQKMSGSKQMSQTRLLKQHAHDGPTQQGRYGASRDNKASCYRRERA